MPWPAGRDPVQPPKVWVQYVPYDPPRATPTPMCRNEQFRMLARWPELPIHDAITDDADPWPAAMFSPIVPPEYPTARMRSANERPSRLVCEK